MAVETPVFYYDVASPWSWLAGERVHEVLGTVPEWQPVLAATVADVDRAAVARAAAAQGLPAPRWPQHFPFDGELATRAAIDTRTVRDAVVHAEALDLWRLPAVRIGGRLVEGPDAPELAAAA
jgi:2-hydroxychromene-2-carboxylate isomerase